MTETADDRPPVAFKREVLEELDEPTLLVASLVNRGRQANDRAKYLLSLLQAAPIARRRAHWNRSRRSGTSVSPPTFRILDATRSYAVRSASAPTCTPFLARDGSTTI